MLVNWYKERLFFTVSFSFLLWLLWSMKDYKKDVNYVRDVAEAKLAKVHYQKYVKKYISYHKGDLKYILQWTSGNHSPFHFMGIEGSAFIANKCKFTNCYVTDNRYYFSDFTKFHAVVFNGHEVVKMKAADLPQVRGENQKFIFGTMESAHYYPSCAPYLDDFFNWTWTYRLDSDVRWGYITAYDNKGDFVAPKTNMKWPELTGSISDEVKDKIKNKNKAVAWFVSNCKSKNGRELFVEALTAQLSKYNLTVDVYGKCGTFLCPCDSSYCLKILQTDYYFYLAFENSFAEDYVTEKVITALNSYIVPVVYGAANYTRFLPPNSYLDAVSLGPTKLAATIRDIIENRSRYEEFFRWRQHYFYIETSESEDVCNLCALLNDETKYNTESRYIDFMKWWNPKDIKC